MTYSVDFQSRPLGLVRLRVVVGTRDTNRTRIPLNRLKVCVRIFFSSVDYRYRPRHSDLVEDPSKGGLPDSENKNSNDETK